MITICNCDGCGAGLCFGAVKCDDCGASCDPDKTRGFTEERKLTRGDTWVADFDLVDADGIPIDLDAPGVKVWFTIAEQLPRLATSSVLWQGTLGSGIVAVSPATSGKARVTIPASATQYLGDGVVRLYYDMQVLDAAARVTTVEKGIFVVLPDVTRAIS